MAFVSVNSVHFLSATADVVIDTGTTPNRKAIIGYVHQQVTADRTGTASRDPNGVNEPCILERHSTVLNQFDAHYVMDTYYLDLTVTGSQTFRFNTTGGSPFRSHAAVLVWDGLVPGPAQVIENYNTTVDSSVISDDITTIANNSLITQFGYLMVFGSDYTWTPDNGQTERIDAAGSGLAFTVGTLVKETEGTQTIGSTATATADVTGQVLLSYAPIVIPPNILTFASNRGSPLQLVPSDGRGSPLVIR